MLKFLQTRKYSDNFIAESSRLEAFSDAIIAIIMTLLVLEVHPPDLSGLSVAEGFKAFIPLWPKLAAFAFSFFTLAVIWVNHHHFFHA